MERIENESQLLEKILADLKKENPKEISILAGHFPLRVNPQNKKIFEDLEVWGDFSPLTFKLGCKIGEFAQKQGSKITFILLCDDHSYRDLDKNLLAEIEDLTEAQLDNRWRTSRDKFYKSLSANNAQIPKRYEQTLKKHGFSRENILRHNHEKSERKNCLYFSESVLRDPTRSPASTNLENIAPCSREYIALLESPNFKKSYLISFIPNKCSHHICDAVDFFVRDFKGSHIFMDTFDKPEKEAIFSKGVYYKKNSGFY